jgi:hypothetical protein
MQQIYLPILVSSHNKLLLSLATAEVNIKKNYLLLTMENFFLYYRRYISLSWDSERKVAKVERGYRRLQESQPNISE